MEDRALLSVSAAEFSQIRAAYPEFDLPTALSALNVIEIPADRLSVANLKTAIAEAGTTTQDDLIVVRTTAAANRITFAAATDAIDINIDAEEYGELSIVALGTQTLTLDAAQQSRVLNVADGSVVEMGKLTITDGQDLNGRGGGIYNAGTITAANVAVTGNKSHRSAGSAYGGGIYNVGTFAATNLVVAENDVETGRGSGSGGGIYNEVDATFTATNLDVAGNSAKSNDGVGIKNRGTFTATNLNVFDNVSDKIASSGILNEGTFTTVNAIVSGNLGYGIYNLVNATFTATNVTVSGNSASSRGGGIYNRESYAAVTAKNTIVAFNFSPDGADVYRSSGTLDAYCVLSSYAAWTTSANCLVYDASKPLFVVGPIFDAEGDLTNADALDLRLASGSQAIDAGNNAYVAGISTDLAGNARIQGNAVDLGAYESTPTSVESLATPQISRIDVGKNVVVRWGKVENAGGYEIRYAVAGSSEYQTVTVDSSKSAVILSDLAGSTTYSFRVKAVGGGSYADSDYSAIKTATTVGAAKTTAFVALDSVFADSGADEDDEFWAFF